MTTEPVATPAAAHGRPPRIVLRARRASTSPGVDTAPGGQPRDRAVPGPEEQVKRACDERLESCDRIKGLKRSGQHRRARQEQDRLLKSRYGKVAALEAVNRKRRVTDRLAAEDILRLADGLDLYRPSPDHAFLRLGEKPGGGYRPIADFSFRDKARQLLARWALEPFAEGHPSQYLLRGGPKAAVEAAISAITEGRKWAVITDIRDCFGSFDVERVVELLPLPRRVTRSVILSEGYSWQGEQAEGVRRDTLLRVVWRTGQRGIPQGSKVSPFVAEHLLSDLLLGLPGEARAVMYVDNIWVFVRTREEAERIKELLRAAAERHRAGLLCLKPIEIRRVADWIEILGYRLRTRYGKIRIEPSPANLWMAKAFCFGLILARKDLNHVEGYVRSWSASFGLWPDAAAFRDLVLASVSGTRELMARS